MTDVYTFGVDSQHMEFTQMKTINRLSIGLLALLGCVSMQSAHAQCPLYNPYLGTQTIIPCWGWQQAPAPKPVVLPAFKPLALGTTAAVIKGNFAENFLYFVETNPNLNTLITNGGPVIVARLSTELKALDAAGHTFYILAYAAEKLSAVNLRLLQSAFGPAAMTAAMAYATPAVRAAYNALPVRAPLRYSQYSVSTGGILPPYDLTQRHLYDLFLLQYFSANDTPTIAVHKAVIYMQVRMKLTVMDLVVITGVTIEVINFLNSDLFQKFEDWVYILSIDPRKPPSIPTVNNQGNFVLTVPDIKYYWPTIDPNLLTMPSVTLPDGEYCVFDLGYPC